MSSTTPKKSRYTDPETFLLEIVGKADDRLGRGAAEILGGAAGAVLAGDLPDKPSFGL